MSGTLVSSYCKIDRKSPNLWSADGNVSLIGHSAGGWLARVYMEEFGLSNISLLLTLGTPHLYVMTSAIVYSLLIDYSHREHSAHRSSSFIVLASHFSIYFSTGIHYFNFFFRGIYLSQATTKGFTGGF